MTTAQPNDPTTAVGDVLAAASPDLLRSMLSTFIQTLMGAEADALCGAGYGERSPERVNSVNKTITTADNMMDYPGAYKCYNPGVDVNTAKSTDETQCHGQRRGRHGKNDSGPGRPI